MISETAKQSEYIFLFWKLAFPEKMYFPENILHEPNAPLVSILGLVQYPFIPILSILLGIGYLG